MESLREAAEKLREVDEEVSEGLSGIREKDIEEGKVVKEDFLFKQVEPVEEISGVVGIDGGLSKKRLGRGDIVAYRAVAVLMEEDGFSYHPSKSPEPEIEVFPAREKEGFEEKASILRNRVELETCLETVDDGRILLDGSIVPRRSDPGLISVYRELMEKVDKGGFVGVVEDSHGLMLSELFAEKLDVDIGEVRDTFLMDQVLEEGERSFVRKYSSSPVEHPVLRNLEENDANSVYIFYLKLSEKDMPLRIEYYGNVDDADSIASELYSLKASDRYTAPVPIIEADKRAKIPESLLSRLEKRFPARELRRDRRIF